MTLLAKKPQRGRAGSPSAFTLVELAVVLVIVSIVLMIAQPRFAGAVQRDRLKRTAFKIQTDLRTLQSEAIRRRSPTALGVGADQEFYVLWYYRAAALKWRTLEYLGPQTAYMNPVGMNQDYGVAIEGLSTGDSYLVFDAYGVPAKNTVLTLGYGTLRVQVTIDAATGKISVGDLYEYVGAKIAFTAVSCPTRAAINATAPGAVEEVGTGY